MAFERGFLNQPEVNDMQEKLLMSVLMQNKINEFKETEAEFERQIMIHRPDVWQKLQEEREEAESMGFDEIVWRSPETIEEFEEIERTLREFEETHIMTPVSEFPQEQPQVIIPPIFNGINLDELGEDE